MLKISQVESTGCAVTLRLEGRVVGPWVAELRQSCEQALAQGRSLTLRLRDVDFLDASGVALISSLQARGVHLTDCPPFVEAQLRASAIC
jgi:anti-anti-sigma regulatory factor